MVKTDFIKKITEQLSGSLPSHLESLKKDFEKNCQTILSKTFSKLDLVTREEFDIQTNVLGRTRAKLEALEKELALLQESLKKGHSNST